MTARRKNSAPAHAAVDRFIAGEDRLSALLRDVPRFLPPESLAVAVATAARAVQARMAAEAEQTAVRTPVQSLSFTPPAALSASVLREAAQLQQAQSARRDAVFDQVLQGKSVSDVLGASVSNATQDWLRMEAAQNRQQAATPATPPARSKPAAHTSRWWRSLGIVASAFAVAGLATRIVLKQLDDGTPMTASLSSHVVLRDTPPPAPASPGTQVEVPLTEAAAAKAAPASAPTITSADHVERRPTAPAPVARKRSEPATASIDSSPPASSLPSLAARHAPLAQASTQTEAALPALPPIAQPMASSMAGAPADAQPEDRGAQEPPPAYAATGPAAGAPARTLRAPQATYRIAAAPSASIVAPAASPAPAMAPMPAMANRSTTATLEDDPAAVALQWQTTRTLRIWSPEPENAAVREWVARLWAAMPANSRPAAPYAIQRDDSLARGQLRIEPAD